MNLLGSIQNALFGPSHGSKEPWETDEIAFEHHFGHSFVEFLELVSHLNSKQLEQYNKTLEVNPEAAVLWVLSMESTE